MTLRAISTSLTLLLLAGCGDDGLSITDEGSAEDTGPPSTTSGPADSTGSPPPATDDGVDGSGSTGEPPDESAWALLEELPGLWVAPVTSMTSVGDFPIMSMDIRPVDDRTLFSRVDLDAANNLRFAFAVEEHDGEPTLVFRNGGYFLGILRDTRTTLVEYDELGPSWRFCAISGGCDYVEAVFERSGPDMLTLSTEVMGRPHMFWEGVLREERPLDEAFPYDPTPGGSGDPFPPMPSLRVTLSWTDPVAEPVDAWVVLSTTDCGLVPGSCYPSRFLRATAEVGATSVELVLDQIHPGDYAANAFLDNNGNLSGTLFPDTGDRVSLPNQDVSVADKGESTASIVLVAEL